MIDNLCILRVYLNINVIVCACISFWLCCGLQSNKRRHDNSGSNTMECTYLAPIEYTCVCLESWMWYSNVVYIRNYVCSTSTEYMFSCQPEAIYWKKNQDVSMSLRRRSVLGKQVIGWWPTRPSCDHIWKRQSIRCMCTDFGVSIFEMFNDMQWWCHSSIPIQHGTSQCKIYRFESRSDQVTRDSRRSRRRCTLKKVNYYESNCTVL